MAFPVKRIATVGMLSLAALCNTFGAESQSGPKSISELRTAIETILKATRTPGAAIAIVSRDKVEWMAGIGKADVAADKPVTTETLFRIASTSKAFAALAALKLQEEGKLKLTDTVRQWVPEVAFTNPWEASDPVRLVHLMEHTTGFDEMHLREYAHNDPTPVGLWEALAYGAASRVSRWRPGSRMAYCNSGAAVLAAVIEKASGQRFEDYVSTHFFQPLHMDTATYFYTPQVAERLTKMYRPNGITTYPYWHICFRSTGAINASVKDMANYVRFHLQRGRLDGTQLLSSSSMERMEMTETLPSAKLGRLAGYGLYNQAILEGPFVFRGHGGAVMGGLTEMAYLAEQGRGYVIMINSGDGVALYQIARLVREYVTRGLTQPTFPPAVQVPIELQQHYGGYYQGISPRNQWLYGIERLLKMRRLIFTGDGLCIYGLGREGWVPISERLFRKADQSVATLALLPDVEGEVMIQSDSETFKKVSALRVWGQLIALAVVSLLVLSSLLFAPIWGLRKLLGKLPDTEPLSVRLLPLISALLLIAFDALLLVGMRGLITARFIDDELTLGVPSLFTISIMLLSIAFPLAAAISLYVVYRRRHAVMNRVVYWHSVLVAAALAVVAMYYGYWGLMGLRLWA
jgi:CubicO group peptidase (beta-lactamase class C family)